MGVAQGVAIWALCFWVIQLQALPTGPGAEETKPDKVTSAANSSDCLVNCVCKNLTDGSESLTCSGPSFSQSTESFCKVVSQMGNATEKLVFYDVRYTNLSCDEANLTGQVSNLIHLEFRNASIETLHPGTFKSFPSLEVLLINFNPIASLNSSQLSNLTNLQVLNLSYNQLDYLAPQTFANLSGLQKIDLSHNRLLSLSDSGLFSTLSKLQTVLLHNNRLTYVHPGVLHDLTALDTLRLDYNELTSLREEIFLNISSFRKVYLNNNPWVCDCGIKWLIEELDFTLEMGEELQQFANPEALLCDAPEHLQGDLIASVNVSGLVCEEPDFGSLIPEDIDVFYYHSAWIHCSAIGEPKPSIYWLGPRGVLVHPQQQTWLPSTIDSFSSKQSYSGQPTFYESSVEAVSNGSLLFTNLRTNFNGTYTCVIENSIGTKNVSVVVSIVTQLHKFVVWGCIYGFSAAGGFLVFSILLGSFRWTYENFIEKKAEPSELNIEDDEEFWEYYFQHISPPDSRESPRKCVTPAEGIDPVKMDLTDDIWETLADVSHRLRDSVAPKVDYVRIRAHQVQVAGKVKMDRVKESGSRHLQTLKSSSQHYVRSLRENSSTRFRTIRESSSTYAHRVRNNMQTVRDQVRSFRELCGNGGDIPNTISITSFSTNVDSQEVETVRKKVTTL